MIRILNNWKTKFSKIAVDSLITQMKNNNNKTLGHEMFVDKIASSLQDSGYPVTEEELNNKKCGGVRMWAGLLHADWNEFAKNAHTQPPDHVHPGRSW